MALGRSLFEQELADDGRILSSLSWLRQSGFSTRVLDERMVIYAANGLACAYCYSADEVVSFARRQSPVRGAGPQAAVAAVDPGPRRIEPVHTTKEHDLEETIRYMRERWHKAVSERDEWERRARSAEHEADTLRAAAIAASTAAARVETAAVRDGDPKYVTLRRFLARELHPDTAPASEQVRRIKSDLFKLVWAEIAKLDKG